MLKLFRFFWENILERMIDARYTSRWIIFCLDLFLSVASIVLSFVLTITLSPVLIKLLPPFKILLFVNTILYATFYLTFKTHSGIVRYSSNQDVWRLLASSFTANLILLVLGLVSSYGFTPGVSLLIWNFTISFVALIAFRLIIVRIFISITSKNVKVLHRAVVYGTSAVSVSMAKEIQNHRKKDYKLIGFLTSDSSVNKKRILDLPVYHLNHNLNFLKALYEIDTVIFTNKENLYNSQENLLDECMKLNLKMMLAKTPMDLIQHEGSESVKALREIQIEDLLGREEIEISTDKIRQQLEGKVILVTGAAGSIGGEIVRQIALFGPSMLLLVDMAETPLHNLELELEDNHRELNYKAIIADIRNVERLKWIFSTFKPQIVYHAAAYKHVPLMEKSPCEAILANVDGTRNVVNLAIRFGSERFVFVSTDKAVNPSNIMGASKRIAEIYVQSLAKYISRRNMPIKFITTRFGNVLGSNGSVIPRFRKQIEDGGPITVTHPEITRYFMTIPEACRLVLEAGNMGENGEIYVFDMGKSVKIKDLAVRMVELAGLIPDQDIKIKYTGLRPGEKLYEELLNDHEITKPTSHKKIMVADVREYNFREVSKSIESLIEMSRRMDVNETVYKMKLLVPEFISENSIYETLDSQIKIQEANKIKTMN
jgi:Predicted nucleoside-diphosphate sugar epimerases